MQKPDRPIPQNSPQNKNQSPIIDLTEAPELTSFYDRTSELSTLKQWICTSKHALDYRLRLKWNWQKRDRPQTHRTNSNRI